MRRPLIWMFFMYLLGILGGQYCLTISNTVLFLFFSFSVIVYLYNKFQWNGILLFPLFLMLGCIRIEQSFCPADSVLDSLIRSHGSYHRIQIVGTVERIDSLKEERMTCIIKSKQMNYMDQSFIKPIKVKAYIKSSEKIEYGDLIHVEGEILAFEPRRNPGGWNEALYMKTRGIEYKFFGDVISIQPYKRNALTILLSLKDQWVEVYDALLPPKQSSILKTMILGDKNGLDQEQKLMYQQAGISHILAISGLHISIIAVLLWWISNSFKISNSISTFSILLLLWIYCIFTGFSVSTVRAVLMITVVLLGKVLRRTYDLYTSTALAAFMILIGQPLFLWDAGFQLSFGAVLGLIFLGPVFNKIFWLPKFIRETLSPTMGAGLATLPIVSYHFYYVSVIGFILNLLIVPLAAFVVWFGFLGGILGFFWMNGAKFTVGIVYYILCFYEWLSRMFIQLPYANLITGAPGIWEIAGYYIVLSIVIFYFSYKRIFNFAHRLLYCIPILCILLWITVLAEPKSFELTVLDVGQGDAIAIHTKNNKHFLIDGGEKDAQRVLIPYLHFKGISSLDAIFLTHPDKDHLFGLLGILEQIKVKKIFVSVEDDGRDEIYHQFITKAKYLDIPCYLLKQGDAITFEDIIINCLYPKSNETEIGEEGWNKISMVLRVIHKDVSFLLTGDIEEEQESNIVNFYKPIQVDFLKAPHHGSKTSSTEEFLNWCRPKNVFISCGKNNRYGHPHEEILDRYTHHGISVLTTAESGAIIIESNGNDYKINTMIKENRGNAYDTVKRAIQKKYFSVCLLILWGGAVFKKVLFRRNTEKIDPS